MARQQEQGSSTSYRYNNDRTVVDLNPITGSCLAIVALVLVILRVCLEAEKNH